VAQFLPSLVGGLYWRRATHYGAIAGLLAGFAVWAFTLFLPSFESTMSPEIVEHGLFGWAWLRPNALFGLTGLDPLVHAVFWSLFWNVVLFVGVSLASEPTPLARVQSTLFIDVIRRQTESELRVIRRTARVADLRAVADRVLGHEAAAALLRQGGVQAATLAEQRSLIAGEEMITLVERRLAAHIGAASARSLVSRVVTDETISVEELKRLAGETEQIRAYSAELERKSRQLEAAAEELSLANERLREMDVQKDEFLSQVSHEVRTPMSSIRSFSDILMTSPELDDRQRNRFLGIIHNESLRLTRLLDGILDLNQMQHGEPSWQMEEFDPETTIDRTLESCEALAHSAGVRLERGGRTTGCLVHGNPEKLAQVVINLVSNAIKYNTSPDPTVRVSTTASGGRYEIRVADNGPGIAPGDRERIFTKVTRGRTARHGGAGLGLAISRHIAERLGGELLLAGENSPGAEFVLRLPLHAAVGARAVSA
jgi:signal transduction histidine kinase